MYIFDETVSSLDEKRRTLFYNIIETLRNQGKIIILITHYVEQNQQFDKIINLDKELNL